MNPIARCATVVVIIILAWSASAASANVADTEYVPADSEPVRGGDTPPGDEPEAASEDEPEAANEDVPTLTAPYSPPRHRVFYRNATLARYNPQGLQNRFELGYRYRLYTDDDRLWRDAHVGISFKPMLTPAFTKLSVSAHALPVAVLRLEAVAHLVGYYGVLGHPRPVSDPTVDVSDTAHEAFEADSDGDSAWAFELDLVAELRAQIGPVIVRSTTTIRRTDFFGDKTAEAYIYDPLDDIIRARHGWSVTNNSDVLVSLLSDQLIVGARYTVAHALYSDHPDRPAHHRIGPLIAYKFFKDPGAMIDEPMLFLLVQWHLLHPHRTGGDVNQGVPYGVIGVSFKGDLWSKDG